MLVLGAHPLTRAAEQTTDGFRIALPGYRYQFPRDHGSHPEFKIEWWYLTGHLWTADRNRRFGYQATFFRSGVRPIEPGTKVSDTFGSDQIYLAHMTILEVETGEFSYEERLNRNGWDASANESKLEVRNGNWSLVMTGDPADESMHLVGSVRADAMFRLQLTPEKPKVLFGNDGVSRKGADQSAASHYITFTRLQTTGKLDFHGVELSVTGQTWMDHEISSSQLTDEQVGWDWASIQLHDGTEIMVYVMRRDDGTVDPFSTLAWIDETGTVSHYTPDQFSWEKSAWWKSPHSGANYPIGSTLSIPHPARDQNGQLAITLKPLAKDQEIQGELGGIRYWEGACDVLDESSNLIGHAYVELTGYDGKLSSTLR